MPRINLEISRFQLIFENENDFKEFIERLNQSAKRFGYKIVLRKISTKKSKGGEE